MMPLSGPSGGNNRFNNQRGTEQAGGGRRGQERTGGGRRGAKRHFMSPNVISFECDSYITDSDNYDYVVLMWGPKITKLDNESIVKHLGQLLLLLCYIYKI